MTIVEKAKTKLKRLKIDRVDLVDKGAAPGAHIALFKRDDTVSEEQDYLDVMYAAPEDVDVAKKAFSPDDRKKLADEGKAMPDGSFPIVTAQDLKNAKQAIGRVSPDKQDDVKAHINARAKDLGEKPIGKNFADVCDNTQDDIITNSGGHVPDTEERVAELEKSLADAEAALEVAKAAAAPKTVDEPTEIAKALEPITKELEDVRKANIELAAQVAKAADEKLTTESIAKAATMKNLPGTPEERGSVLKSARLALDDEAYAAFEAQLRAANEGMAKAFREAGIEGDTDTSDPYAAIENLAKARATEKGESIAKAMTEVLNTEEGRTLYAEYTKNRSK